MFINLYDDGTIPSVGSSVTFTIPDGQPRIPLRVASFNIATDEEGDILVATVTGSVLSSGTYGFKEEARHYNEGDEIVNRKIKAALANEITPIFCIGEELSIREAGTHVEHVLNQIRNGLKGFHKPDLKKIVFAYEPVWAIGTGKTASAEDAQEVCAAIRIELAKIGSAEIAEAARILYGGSVKSSNIVEIMKQEDIDGVLVGGASLDAEEFARIARFHRAVTA
jgi:triosephosphate isomerase